MAGPWLYTIAEKAGKMFDIQGESIPLTVHSYRTLVENGRLVEDAWWYISQHWRHVEQDDEIFIYTGDQDTGIIGYATINGLEERSDVWCLRLKFDLNRCRMLLDHPIPAATVRAWVPFPRKNVINLAPFDQQLRDHLPWLVGQSL